LQERKKIMSQQVKGFAEHYAGFKRHLKLALAVTVAIMTFGVGFAFSLPDVYRSSAFILIEDPDIPEEIVRSTVTTYTSRELTTLNEKILTVRNLIRIIEEFDLYPEKRRNQPVELLAMDMRMAIGIEIQSRDSVSPGGLPQLTVVGFNVSFEDENPEVTKKVVDELANLYVQENIKARSAQTSEVRVFLEGEIEKLEEQIAILEGGLADFKLKNAEILPSMNSSNLGMIARTDDNLMALDRRLYSLEGTRLGIEAQLATVEPSMPVRLADGSYALSPADQLRSLQTTLSIYDSKYSEDHPDVIAARRDIASLKERFGVDADLGKMDEEIVAVRAELAVEEKKYSPDHPDVIQSRNRLNKLIQERNASELKQLESEVFPDNPSYISLQTALATLNAEEAALKAEQKLLLARLADYEARLTKTPLIEKELSGLQRTLSSTSNRYWVLRDKQFAAVMGETLETENKGEAMVLLEPARVPLSPFEPNRSAIISLALLFALVAGVGVTQLADALDHSIRDSAGIMSVQGVPPLIEIPYIFNEEELAGQLRMRKAAIASIPVVLLISIVIVHFVLQPLDVLFYAIAARLGF
jgi:succinoglycan biosynthesis transport protein ExoP